MNVEAFSTSKGTKFATTFLRCGGHSMMVVDESTTIKNPKAARTKSIIKIGMLARYKRILTGEPVTRSPLDLYTQFNFLNDAGLGFSSYYTFRNRYAVMKTMHVRGRSIQVVHAFQNMGE